MSYIPQNGLWDTVQTIGKGAAKGALDIYAEGKRQEGAAAAYKAQLEAQAAAQMAASQRRMPGWVLPAAIGGGALMLMLLLKKK